ncbi:phage terminase large subunit [Aneurinibacillus aneurinilyticus]|jgi:predicted phage terminase large subunit-like protein|uniref:phage terminase large subunit n=1 Tax=Aneurinibacillus aneurinilyticus TaxID=1391 RepID=UPI0023F9C8EA|nr:phage terminase large subunit [Aneurinibacillus aneurinilyticus]MCI1696477.1 phage terminase large subunit [Aneurinibacillus aneurinilyticus]
MPLSESEEIEYLRLLEEEAEYMAGQKLVSFLEYESDGMWKSARHLEHLCEKLEAVERGEIRRLMVFMPPRHGKSEVVSKKFPSYFLGRNPDKEVIISSYSSDLAYDFSRIARNTLKEWGMRLWGIQVAKDSGAVGRWGIDGTRGGFTAAGVGGPITGRGAHVAIIDDPFKNWQDAASKTIRETVWDWYRSTLRTRLAPGGAVILVMTRWHEDDLAGRLLKEMKEGTGEHWEVVSLPAVAEEGDSLGREVGEVLWPERFPPHEYSEMKRAVGSRLWISLYQQRPAPDEGQIFKRDWWRFYRELPSAFDEVIQSWDCTFKDSNDSDYVVGQVWGRIGADKYLLDQVRAQMNFPATISAIRSLSAKWPQAHAKYVEDKANGPAVIATLKREISGLIPVNPEGGKVVRAQAVSPAIEAGNVFLPDSSIAPWIHDFIEEYAAFPNGANDDQVDCGTQAINKLENANVPVGRGISVNVSGMFD